MEKFEYTYSAPTEEEKRKVEDIRRQYVEETPCVDKVARIKALNDKVKKPPMAIAITIGVVGCLLFGLGLTMVLEWGIWLWGIAVMAVGCLPMIAAYPIHQALLKAGKKKYGAEIVRLSDEVLAEK